MEDIKQKIDYVQLEFGDFPFRRNNIICRINDEDKISAFTNLLNNIDSKNKSGHVSTTLEFQIDINFAENNKRQYLGWIYNKHPNDVYLDISLWEATDSGSYRRSASGEFRVPNAAAWIHQRHQECLK